MSWLRGVGSAMALVVAAVFLVVGPSQAVGESVQVLTVDHASCADTEYALGIAIDIAEGGDPYVLRTLVTIGGLVYANAENAITIDEPVTGWNLFNVFNYGAVANPGTWPMPSGQQMRVDFTLERIPARGSNLCRCNAIPHRIRRAVKRVVHPQRAKDAFL